MAGGMHQFPDQTSSDHHGRRPQLLGPMPRIVADRADVPMHAGAEPVTTPRRLESAALVPKARQFRKNPTWKSELTVKINADSGSNIEVFYRADATGFAWRLFGEFGKLRSASMKGHRPLRRRCPGL